MLAGSVAFGKSARNLWKQTRKDALQQRVNELKMGDRVKFPPKKMLMSLRASGSSGGLEGTEIVGFGNLKWCARHERFQK